MNSMVLESETSLFGFVVRERILIRNDSFCMVRSAVFPLTQILAVSINTGSLQGANFGGAQDDAEST
jgi:hypothetical protein